MKPIFDVELSLRECPPEKRPNLVPGAKFIKRIVTKRNKVAYLPENQIRYVSVRQDNADDIKISFQINGYIHTEYPPVIVVNPHNRDEFIGETGFTRDQAADSNSWDTMIYDVYEFDSPLTQRKFRIKSNIVNTPKKPNTKQDLINQTVASLAAGEIENTDDAIISFINDVAPDKSSKEKNNILKSVRGRKSAHPSLLTYHCDGGSNSTEEAASKYKLPFSGDTNLKLTGKLGYIPSSSTPKTTISDSKKLLLDYGYQDIEFHFFLPEPKMPGALYKQRQAHVDSFKNFVKKEAEWVHLLLEQLNIDVPVSDIERVLPWKVKGFLPQYIGADPQKGGNPKESAIVDANGLEVL